MNPIEGPFANELPEGWCSCAMGDIAVVIGGGTPRTSDRSNYADNGYPWLTPADLRSFDGVYVSRGTRSLSKKGIHGSSAKMVPAGTVLMSSRAPIGYLAIAANPISTNQGFKSFVCHKSIVPEYVFYWLKSIRPLLESMGHGSTFSEISGSRAHGIPVAIAPLAEQQRIVAKVEELLTRVTAARDHLEKVPAIMKRFRQAVLAAACSGKLTEDWRERHPNVTTVPEACPPVAGHFQLPDGWNWCQAGDFYEDARYGTSVKCARTQEGSVPVLRIPNIVTGRVDLSDLKFAECGQKELENLLLEPGDVIVCRTNGSLDLIGKAAVVPPLSSAHAFASYLIRVRLRTNQLSPEYYHLFISSKMGRDQIEEKARSTAGQFNLNLRILHELILPIPPIQEQHEIVRCVEALFKVADSVEKRVTLAKMRADKLTQAILAKAFRGELVPTEAELSRREGRSYEPASVLLERIRAERKRQSSSKGDKFQKPRGVC